MKKTLICTHVMPYEIEMFERLMDRYHTAFKYLDKGDDVTIRATLNLNPQLTDWDESELKQDYFIDIFNKQFGSLKTDNQIITDTSCWGTTQQKRECIELDYEQFIFCDTDILFHPHQLKYQLDTSYQLDGMYVLSPSLPKWWDGSWDILCHRDYMHKEYGFANSAECGRFTETQEIERIETKRIPHIKFGCGMHTLYSKSFWKFVGIPESFGGYGPEDTFAMTISNLAIGNGYDIKQYVMDGIFITEDYENRTPSFEGKLIIFDKKREFYKKAENTARDNLIDFLKRNPKKM